MSRAHGAIAQTRALLQGQEDYWAAWEAHERSLRALRVSHLPAETVRLCLRAHEVMRDSQQTIAQTRALLLAFPFAAQKEVLTNGTE